MDKSNLTMAQQIARAARAFDQQRIRHAPKSAVAVPSGETRAVTLSASSSPAEYVLDKSPAGAVQALASHRQSFANASVALREEIKRILSAIHAALSTVS